MRCRVLELRLRLGRAVDSLALNDVVELRLRLGRAVDSLALNNVVA